MAVARSAPTVGAEAPGAELDDVVLVRWPAEGERRQRLALEGVPRLLLVAPGETPPQVTDPIEDWVRLPAADADVEARVRTLADRAANQHRARPEIDDDGVLRFRDRWVAIPPVEGRLVTALLDRMGTVVSREALTRAGWPEGSPGRNALDVHVLRLRRRLAEVGLAIRTVRSRGYLLEADRAPAGRTSSDRGQEPVRDA